MSRYVGNIFHNASCADAQELTSFVLCYEAWRWLGARYNSSMSDRLSVRPDFISPMLPAYANTPPKGDAWLHEPKWDGYRFQVVDSPLPTTLKDIANSIRSSPEWAGIACRSASCRSSSQATHHSSAELLVDFPQCRELLIAQLGAGLPVALNIRDDLRVPLTDVWGQKCTKI